MLLVSNIQRFCLHDGPGIRTTVFLKGCPLRCPWCCNPENRSFSPQYFFKKDKCLLNHGIACHECDDLLAKEGVSTPAELAGRHVSAWKKSYDPCSLALGIFGRWLDEMQLRAVLEEDRPYYKQSGGGVTLSGGEPLAHPIQELVCNLSQSGIPVAIETSLLVESTCLTSLLDHVSLFIVDAKVLDQENCHHILGGDSKIFSENLGKIVNANIQILLRVPLIGKFTVTDENLWRICDIVCAHRITSVQLLPQHHFGDEKYLQLAENPFSCAELLPVEIERIAKRISTDTGASVEILSF